MAVSGQLSRLLLKLFAKGEISGTTVHDLAAAAWLDGWGRGDALAQRLVKAGRQGRRRNEMANDVIKAAEAAGLVCSRALPYEVTLSTGGTASIFLPHEFYTAMVEDLGLPQLCLSPESLVADEGLPGLLKAWSTNDDVEFAGDLSTVGVLGMHCDGVQYTSSMRAGGARSVVVGSMNVISAGEIIRQRRQPLFVLRKGRFCKCGCQGFHTIQELMAVVAWSVTLYGKDEPDPSPNQYLWFCTCSLRRGYQCSLTRGYVAWNEPDLLQKADVYCCRSTTIYFGVVMVRLCQPIGEVLGARCHPGVPSRWLGLVRR
jgi:hypothetical protein